jgi:hypothetical protein
MWIVITNPFIDKLADDPEAANVPAGKKMNVTADRGAELMGLGLAEESDSDAAPAPASKPARTRAKAKAKAKPKPKAEKSAPVIGPAPAPLAAAETGNHPIALGSAGPVDGHPAGEDFPHN